MNDGAKFVSQGKDNGLGKNAFIKLTFCIIGIWLVWEFRLLGVFVYSALLFCVSLAGAFHAEFMPKDKEKKIARAMYWTMFAISVAVVAMSYTDWMKPISIAVAKGPILPSFQDNVVLLLDGSKEDVAQLLADTDAQKRRRIIKEIEAAKERIYVYYTVNLISIALSLIYVVFTSMCITKSRRAFIDEAALDASVREQGRVIVTHTLLKGRVAFCLAGVIYLGLAFLYFVAFKIGPDNVGTFWAGRGRFGYNESPSYFVGLLMYQGYAYFVLWHFARYPFALIRRK